MKSSDNDKKIETNSKISFHENILRFENIYRWEKTLLGEKIGLSDISFELRFWKNLMILLERQIKEYRNEILDDWTEKHKIFIFKIELK